MSISNRNATTYSMIIAGVIESYLKRDGYKQTDLFERTVITQPTWARLCRGQSKLDVEQLYSIQEKFGYRINDVLSVAERVEQTARADDMNIIPPIPTQQGKLTKPDGLTIVAVAVLAYLAVKAAKKAN